MKRLEHLSYEQRLGKELGPFSLEKRMFCAGGMDLINVYKEEEKKKDMLSSVIPSDRTRGDGHKLKNESFIPSKT